MMPSMLSSNLRVPVRPSECALLLGIPLSEAEFRRDLERPGATEPSAPNYAQTIALQQYPGIRREDLGRYYQRDVVQPVLRSCSQFEAMGVKTALAKDLCDLRGTLTSGCYKVVSLLTHSGWVPIQPEDLPDIAGLIRFLRAEGQRLVVLASLLEDLERHLPALKTAAAVDGTLPADLEAAVRARIRVLTDQGQEYYEKPASQYEGPAPTDGDRPFATAFTRALLEHYLPDTLLRPCRAVEFRNGMHTAQDFIQAVTCDFNGVLHLMSCSSSLYCIGLANRARRYLTFMDAKQLLPWVQLLLFKAVMRELADNPRPYLDVQEWVRANVPDKLPVSGPHVAEDR
jgi:hypothetical protein